MRIPKKRLMRALALGQIGDQVGELFVLGKSNKSRATRAGTNVGNSSPPSRVEKPADYIDVLKKLELDPRRIRLNLEIPLLEKERPLYKRKLLEDIGAFSVQTPFVDQKTICHRNYLDNSLELISYNRNGIRCYLDPKNIDLNAPSYVLKERFKLVLFQGSNPVPMNNGQIPHFFKIARRELTDQEALKILNDIGKILGF